MRSQTVSLKLRRIAKEARENPERVFTNLAQLIDVELLTEAYRGLNKRAAAGVDGVTHEEYGRNLEGNLRDLHERLRTLKYRAQPALRGYVPKDEQTKRPIAKSALEDKVVQGAVVMLLGEVYEQDFYDFSRAFRAGRNPHQALAEVRQWCMGMNIGWILDLDICGYFDNIPWKPLLDAVRKRVNDGGIIRLIGKWLNAGIQEEGKTVHPDKGTPQGSVISPLLSNIYLHHVLDEWFVKEIQPRLKGRAFISRFADDAVLGFELEEDAKLVQRMVRERMEQHGLQLHREKTKLIAFRRPSRKQQDGKGEGTFDYLGFTHYWARSVRGDWVIKRKTRRKKQRQVIQAFWQWCRWNRHLPVGEQHRTLCSKLRGHYQYFSVRCNLPMLKGVRREASKAWHYWLSRRGQPKPMTWEEYRELLSKFPLPEPRILHSI